MEKAIRRAIEGGYEGTKFYEEIEDLIVLDLAKKLYLLDPLFWQALGRSEGWDDKGFEECVQCNSSYFECNGKHTSLLKKYGSEAIYHWHSFIDHLAGGKDIDSFFDALLTNKD